MTKTIDQLGLMFEKNGRLYRYILRLTEDRFIADDICQDTYLKVLQAFDNGKYEEKGHLLAFVRRIGYNIFIDHKRKAKKSGTKYYNDLRFYKVPYDDVCSDRMNVEEQQHQQINSAIDLIKNADVRDVLLLRMFYNMNFKKISGLMNCNVNTSLGRMRYAMKHIRAN